jgi:para-nitrobenzyl esterase
VLSQLASSGAKGLFDRAVVESGAYNLTQASLATAEADGQAFAAKVGCASQTAACLRGVPAATLVANEGTGYTPDIDGRVLTESLKTSFADGRFNRVPVVNGSNHDEYRLFVALSELEGAPVTAANYQAAIASTLGVPAATAAAIVAQYPLSAYPSPALALSALGTDAIFSCGALSVDRSVSRFVPTYAYEFNDENAPQTLLPPVDFPYGAAHASEIQYLFDANANQTSALNAAQQRLAGTMQGYWTTFAGRGAPSSLGSPLWPPFSGTTQRIQSLDTPRPQVETDFATEHNCAFWAQVG